MKAIHVKYLTATYERPARLKATAEGWGSITHSTSALEHSAPGDIENQVALIAMMLVQRGMGKYYTDADARAPWVVGALPQGWAVVQAGDSVTQYSGRWAEEVGK